MPPSSPTARPPLSDIANHYERYPFPGEGRIVVPTPARFFRDRLSFLLKRRPPEWLSARSRIWVAGCGTQQACHIALSFPNGEILATDVSEHALSRSRELAKQLGLENIRFEQDDLECSGFSSEFDLVVATGVVHHLTDPRLGFTLLRRALLPGGAALLMVYNRLHRDPLQQFRRAFDLLGNDESPQERYQRALETLAAFVGGSETSNDPPRPGREALTELWRRHRHERSFLADALLNPQEKTYDIDELRQDLDHAGLRHTSWIVPAEWQLRTYVDSAVLLDPFDELDSWTQARVVYSLAGYGGPMMTFLAESADSPIAHPYELDELTAMPILCSPGARVIEIEQGEIRSDEMRPSYETEELRFSGRLDDGLGVSFSWSLPLRFEPVLAACNGSRTYADLLREQSEELGRETLLELLVSLLPGDIGLLVPSPFEESIVA